jgi:hypothetical protein
VGKEIRIARNPLLTSLSGLDNIKTSAIQELYIVDNFALSECAVKSVCDYLGIPGGNITILKNIDECYDLKAVQAACGVGVEETLSKAAVLISPNPVRDGRVSLTFGNNDNKITEVRCYNVYGQEVHKEMIKSKSGEYVLNTQAWKAGIYLVEIYAYRKPVGRAKFVVR